MTQWGVHWFRRDLRVRDNPALEWNRKQQGGRVVGMFCFDPKFLARPDFSVDRFAFFVETLEKLRAELREAGSDLWIWDEGPDATFERLLTGLREDGKPPAAVSWNRDYEPFARERDARIERLIETRFGVPVHTERDHLVIEPIELSRGKPGEFYQIFTPFKKKWLSLFESDEIQERLKRKRSSRFDLNWKQLLKKDAWARDVLLETRKSLAPRTRVKIPAAGHAVALDQLRKFAQFDLSEYATRRDVPSVAGTSQLSIFLKNGSLTTAQILSELEKCRSKEKFVSELIWREFYYHILHHVPRVEQGPFHLKYAQIPWENREDLFEAWKTGTTGYPIVDAGMRQLNATGWMHNRVRMIVASFLTKDLHIDWRWGERYFMERLLDGDLAPNNGGWQWAASTGCDPQPYFRIFNPTLQSQRFDPEGEYIRAWVPELRGIPSKEIHEPAKFGVKGYAKPVVIHAERAKKAVSLYRGTQT